MTGHTDSIHTLGTATVAGRTTAVSSANVGGQPISETRVWDLASGWQIGEPVTGHRLHMVTEIAGSPVAVTEGDGIIRVWDLNLATR
ncbi:hypothetical protein ACWCQP_47730 [Streptomyces chartreusis]